MFYSIFTDLCSKKMISPTATLQTLGISTSKLTAWKNGSLPSASVLILISEFFGVTIDYLLTGKRPETIQPFELENANEKTMMRLFRQLSEKEQDRIIGRLELMVEQSDNINHKEAI